jgi:amino acid adenylation domain-containing protein
MNNTENKTLVHFFEEQVQKTPNEIAIVFEDKRLTYQELNESVNQLAHYIVRFDSIAKGDSISICIKKSEYIIIALLGVIKSGCSYVLLDQSLPEKRIDFITNNSKSKLFIDDEFLMKFNAQRSSISKENLNLPIQLSDRVYLMYTSGTTGNPKGAINTHRGFLNTLQWYVNDIGINASSNIGVISNLSFDLTQKNYFAPLLVGATIFMSNDADLSSLDQFIYDHQITLINCAPTLFYAIIENGDYLLKSLEKVILGGEHINYPIIENFIQENEVDVYNSYGPSEASDVATCYQLKKNEKGIIPIGKPIKNTTILLLDKALQPVALGIEGEIYIGGVGVGVGYFNEEKLTQEKFISTTDFGRIYKTGDWGRLNANEEIEFLGRKDGQIKIRGNRIEIEEIENQIHRFDRTLKRIIVDVKELNGEKILVAYYESSNLINKLELRQHLSSILPNYMIPSHFVQLEEIPTTPSGKVSKKDLPQIDLTYVPTKEYVEPSTDLEKALTNIWQDVLKIEKIGVTEDFFDLGGDSLRSLRTVSKINHSSDTKININDLYKYSTIQSLSAFISNKDSGKSNDHLKSEIDHLFRNNLGNAYVPNTLYQASDDQFFNWKLLKSEKYGKRFIIDNNRIQEPLDRELVMETIKALFKKHQILNVSFKEIDGLLYQKFQDDFQVETLVDFVHAKDTDASYMSEQLNSLVFDLDEEDPLIHFFMVDYDDYFDLTLASNHLLIDGWSSNLLKNDFSKIYSNLSQQSELKSASPTATYLDFSIWKNKVLLNQKMKDAYFSIWDDYLKNLPSKSNIPYDSSGTEKNYNSSFEMFLSPTLTENIRRYSSQNRVSGFSLLLASLFKVLHKAIGESHISVGIANPNRLFDELFDVVGEFANASVIVQNMTSSEDTLSFIKNVNQNLNTVLELPVLPFKALGLKHTVTDLFSVMLNMISYEEIKDTEITPAKHNPKVSIGRWEIGFYVYEFKQALKLNVRYNPNLYAPETIEKLTNDYVKEIDKLSK